MWAWRAAGSEGDNAIQIWKDRECSTLTGRPAQRCVRRSVPLTSQAVPPTRRGLPARSGDSLFAAVVSSRLSRVLTTCSLCVCRHTASRAASAAKPPESTRASSCTPPAASARPHAASELRDSSLPLRQSSQRLARLIHQGRPRRSAAQRLVAHPCPTSRRAPCRALPICGVFHLPLHTLFPFSRCRCGNAASAAAH